MLKEVSKENRAPAPVEKTTDLVRQPIMRVMPKSPIQATNGAMAKLEDRESYSVTAIGDVTIARCMLRSHVLPAAFHRQQSGAPTSTGLCILPWRPANDCNSWIRQSARRSGSPPMPAVHSWMRTPNVVFSRSHRTAVLPQRVGKNGRFVSSPKLFCCSSNGGTMRRPVCMAFQ
jgi:hypothetical protein